jgi:hypothetical protein
MPSNKNSLLLKLRKYLCLCLCLFLCLCLCLCLCVCVCPHTSISLRVPVCVRVPVCASLHQRVYAHPFILMFIHVLLYFIHSVADSSISNIDEERIALLDEQPISTVEYVDLESDMTFTTALINETHTSVQQMRDDMAIAEGTMQVYITPFYFLLYSDITV